MLKQFIKNCSQIVGITVERKDPLEKNIPADYVKSQFLPRVYQNSLARILYFRDMLEKVRHIEGDIVECGVSIGHGTLLWLLLSEYIGVERVYYGFDSFEGFPDPVDADGKTPITGRGYYANPPDIVLKVLEDGRVPQKLIQDNVRLIKGWFNETLTHYDGTISLLHLDCDLYESYKICLENFYPMVPPGGIIMFDEYQDERWPGSDKAIDEFFSDKPEKILLHHKSYRKYYVQKV